MIVEKQDRTVRRTKVVILRVEGLVKLGESAEFFCAAFEVVAVRIPNIVVDVEKIDYIDSTGLGELVGVCVKLARVGRNIVILQLPTDDRISRPDRLQKLIRVAHAKDDLRVFKSEEEAVTAVVASAPRRKKRTGKPVKKKTTSMNAKFKPFRAWAKVWEWRPLEMWLYDTEEEAQTVFGTPVMPVLVSPLPKPRKNTKSSKRVARGKKNTSRP